MGKTSKFTAEKQKAIIDFCKEHSSSMTMTECARSLKVDWDSVDKYARKGYGIKFLMNGKAPHLQPGNKIGNLTLIRITGKSSGGRLKWLCKCDCGKTVSKVTYYFANAKRHGTTCSCGCLMFPKGENSPSWKGGRIKVAGGYIRLRLPYHPNANCVGYVMEHIKVMSDHLGRAILADETVHHKNGIRDDNRLANLELWTSHHCSGQRVTDKVGYAVEILKLYAPEKLRG